MIPAAAAFGETFERAGRPEPCVSLLFPARNRLEFTRQSWAALMQNTDWSLVKEFHVYDDGSTDGTKEWFGGWEASQLARAGGMPSPTFPTWHDTDFKSPMGVTLDWIRQSKSPILAKLDNDAIYPANWLQAALDTMKRYPQLDMLGLEAMRKTVNACDVYQDGTYETGKDRGRFTYLTAKYVSGLGLYRAKAFNASLPKDGGYFGFEEWMQQHAVKCGWILPSLPVFLLDRLPMEPWRSLSESYVRKGWQRPWSGASPDLRYKPEQAPMWQWWRPIE